MCATSIVKQLHDHLFFVFSSSIISLCRSVVQIKLKYYVCTKREGSILAECFFLCLPVPWMPGPARSLHLDAGGNWIRQQMQ